MRGQIEALIEATKLPNVRLQVIPFDAGGHAAAGGAFTILRFPDQDLPDVVYIEQLTSALYLDKRDDVDHYAVAMERLCVEADAAGAHAGDPRRRILRRALPGVTAAGPRRRPDAALRMVADRQTVDGRHRAGWRRVVEAAVTTDARARRAPPSRATGSTPRWRTRPAGTTTGSAARTTSRPTGTPATRSRRPFPTIRTARPGEPGVPRAAPCATWPARRASGSSSTSAPASRPPTTPTRSPRRIAPESRVVYVDNDPIVLAHARALLTSRPRAPPPTSTPTCATRRRSCADPDLRAHAGPDPAGRR